jgi:hypothetical protein
MESCWWHFGLEIFWGLFVFFLQKIIFKVTFHPTIFDIFKIIAVQLNYFISLPHTTVVSVILFTISELYSSTGTVWLPVVLFVSATSRTVYWQINEAAWIQLLLQIKHDIHKLLTVFPVLPNLTSFLRTDCECTAVRYTNVQLSGTQKYICLVHNYQTAHIGVIFLSSLLQLLERCCFSVSGPGRLIPYTHWIVGSVCSISYLHGF